MAQQTVQVLNNYIDGQWVEAAAEDRNGIQSSVW